jgi:hypothetical protein
VPSRLVSGTPTNLHVLNLLIVPPHTSSCPEQLLASHIPATRLTYWWSVARRIHGPNQYTDWFSSSITSPIIVGTHPFT